MFLPCKFQPHSPDIRHWWNGKVAHTRPAPGESSHWAALWGLWTWHVGVFPSAASVDLEVHGSVNLLLTASVKGILWEEEGV